jgi:3-oxoacyl-[acyl-carrier protein] reductase
MNLSLLKKTALVCGSTQGIGLASAIELAALGVNCILLARNENALKEAVNKLDISQQQQHQYLIADFDKPEEVRNVINSFMITNEVHILINNSGGPQGGPITLATEDEFINAFNRHLICNHILTKAVMHSMKAAGYGRIINIISTSVKIPVPNLGVSNTTRGAVARWAKTMANELGQFNITVNNVLPGYTNTQRLQSIIENFAAKRNTSTSNIAAEMQAEIPVRRFGEAAEIAAVIAFLASPAASFVNGTSIPVDGGRTGSL